MPALTEGAVEDVAGGANPPPMYPFFVNCYLKIRLSIDIYSYERSVTLRAINDSSTMRMAAYCGYLLRSAESHALHAWVVESITS